MSSSEGETEVERVEGAEAAPSRNVPLIFREEKEGRLLAIGDPHLVVDIRCCQGRATEEYEKQAISLVWGDIDRSSLIKKTLRLLVSDTASIIPGLYDGLTEQSFTHLRAFATELYRTFSVRLIKVDFTSIAFELGVQSEGLLGVLEEGGETVEALCRSLLEQCCGEDVDEFAVVFEDPDTSTMRATTTREVTSTQREKVSPERVLSMVRAAREGKRDVGYARITESVEAALVDEEVVSASVVSLSTVLCLDSSASMAGDAFHQMKAIANIFVDGIDETAVSHGVEENLAVVSMSERARVVQHLTIDYASVRAAIESLDPDGLSPIFETLVVAQTAILKKGGVYQMSTGNKVSPRIIFITDGKVTDENQEGGSDATSSSARMPLIELVLRLAAENTHIIWVPVGNADREFLNSLAKLGDEKVVEEANVPSLISFLRKQKAVGKIYSHARNTPAMLGQLEEVAKAMLPELSQEDQEDITRSVMGLFQSRMLMDLLNVHEKPREQEDGFDIVHEDPNLPALGTRVIRGPDWKWGDQDSGGVGTIVNHCKDAKNCVRVYWDEGGKNNYRYNADGAFDLLIVDDCPRFPDSQFFLQIGVRVEKDPVYMRRQRDYQEGLTGVVIRIGEDGIVKVRWDDSTITTHKFEPNGVRELIICDPAELLTRQLLASGSPGTPHPGPGAQQGAGQQRSSPKKEAWGKATDDRSAAIHELLHQPRGEIVWRWKDEGGAWNPYQEDVQTKLTEDYKKRPGGTSLITKGDDNFRVAFKTMNEKSVSTDERHEVDAIILEEEGDDGEGKTEEEADVTDVSVESKGEQED